MALQYSKTQFDVQFDEAYLMVKSLKLNKETLNLEAIVCIYPDKTCRDEGSDSLETRRLNIQVDSPEVNLFTAVYDYLKSLDEFSSAIDVLEENQEEQE